jgi:glycosyltransferase involved in cell wall biosynthesis
MTKKLRVAALLSHPIQYVVPLLRRLAAHPEIDLTVYFMSDTGLRARKIAHYGETIQWDTPLLGGYHHEMLANVSPWPDVARPYAKIHPGILPALALGGFDALFMHGYMAATELFTYAAAKALRLPVLFWGDVLLDSPQILTGSRVREAFRTAFAHGLDAALAMSSQARRYYEHYGVPEERIHWAPLCVDGAAWMEKTDALRAAPGRAELRRALGADPALPVIAYVAHMRANKRPRDVVDALAAMTVPASLVMAGGGPLYEELVAYCAQRKSPRVHLLGMRNQGDLPAIYAASDVFVLPSGPGEVTPLVVQEAMCASLPVVISDAVPSTIDFVREGENGYTYPVGDIPALADRLDRVLADPAETARLGAHSRALITPWSYDVTMAGILDALHAVTGTGARKGGAR